MIQFRIFAKEGINMDGKDIRDLILETIEVSLEAQLKSVKRLRGTKEEASVKTKRMSQVDMVEDILRRENGPLHINDILDRVAQRHGQKLDRESIVSALIKKVRRNDRFLRTGKNVFCLKEE
jgi:hypothetical protein